MSSEILKMDIKEFRELGYLQELNRQFLHPLGLALEVVIEEDGTELLGGIWDFREDEEGMYFGFEGDEEYIRKVQSKYENIKKLQEEAFSRRKTLLGFDIQPIPGIDNLKENLVD